MPEPQGNYILLPSHGLRAKRQIEQAFLTRFAGIRSTGPAAALSANEFFGPIRSGFELRAPAALQQTEMETVRVIDSVHEDGPKLVSMTDAAAAALAEADTGLRAVPIRYYEPAQALGKPPSSVPPLASAHSALSISVACATTGQPIPRVKVIAFTSLQNDCGATGVTDLAGRVALRLGGDPIQLDSLYVEAPTSGHWGFYRQTMLVRSGDVIQLEVIAAPYADAIRLHCGPLAATNGAGVRVAVIDSGVGPHPSLKVNDGRNAVPGEPRTDWEDNGLGHGTHVAGIIACNSAAGGPLGVAPAVELWSGRVYGAGADRATNYSIMKAMVLATDNNCDLLNLSLVTDTADPVLQDAVTDASKEGAVVFVASGNDGIATVSFPARCVDAVGISAFGVTGSYPAFTPHDAQVGSPRNGNDYFAAFSNWGTEVRFIGPGVGIISAAVKGGYAVRSGTSMACAATTGLAARLLARDPTLLGATRNAARTAAIQNMLQAHATSLGFGFHYEGSGRL